MRLKAIWILCALALGALAFVRPAAAAAGRRP